ncbi:uncharacterized protein TRUGW13939_08409 [Talaromyces rugulosus]|uniref:Uncharacterized protein n=1 Tax=Talaromyces rugulosus TaxID=121627 RepID=A0A7H8R6B6_TALRU|nr:uncharacterized protein TRUGW13939_08409 [Talaromyces rugulosus]QKX61261.1 hypothetical protein TRUGW13939_08409 [Talaromyces rugulosus]
MFAPPGAPDVLTLATTAYKVYDMYRGAKGRFKEISDAIRLLEITIKTLGKRLEMQDENLKPTLKYDDLGLEEVVQLGTELLEDLQKKAPAGYVPHGVSRFKWSQSEIDSIRSRITTLCSTIAAFNSSLFLQYISSSAPAGLTERRIIHTLDDILVRDQGLSRRDSIASTLIEEGVKNEENIQKSDLWLDLVREMKNHGISENQVTEHREMILQWAASAAAAGILNDKFEKYPAVDENDLESWEVISAVYGLANVTPIMQRIFDAHKGQKSSTLHFTVTNETFGGDSFEYHVKALAMAWRKTIRRGHKILFSSPQKVFAQEGDDVVVDFKTPVSYPEYNEGTAAEATQIIIASWHNRDVTDRISTLVKDMQTSILATDIELLTRYPFPGYARVLSVTWAYGDTFSSSQVHVNTVREGRQLDIPPYLNIVGANWGGLDITATLQTRTSREQTLDIDTEKVYKIASPDPWPNYPKTISLLYQYDHSSLELLVVGEAAGIVTVRPYAATHRSSRWTLDLTLGENTKILAIIWGLQPIQQTPGLQRALQERKIPCNNAFFGGDGWGGVNKTCQVFLRHIRTNEVACLVGREGSILDLKVPWAETM